MFYSTGNNFGAGRIQFKSHQEENFVVLNAKFGVDPSDARYAAADVLEIYIPGLSIDRSTEAGVFFTYEDRRNIYGDVRICDGCTVLKSWIKDRNTLCIEKLPAFDDKSNLKIYILTLYAQLGRGENSIRSVQVPFTPRTVPEGYLSFETTSFMQFDHWAFLHIVFTDCLFEYRTMPWDIELPGFPQDVKMTIPVCGGQCFYNNKVGGAAEVYLKDGRISFPQRNMGFTNSGYFPFIFAFLVRGDNNGYTDAEEPIADDSERMRISIVEQQGEGGLSVEGFVCELGRNFLNVTLSGDLFFDGSGNTGSLVYDSPLPPAFFDVSFYLLVRSANGEGLAIGKVRVLLAKSASGCGVYVSNYPAGVSHCECFDTAAIS